MSKKRYLSDSYIDKKISQIDALFEKNRVVITPPDCLMPETRFGGPGRLSQREREQIKEYYKQFQELSYVNGFWMGWITRDGMKEENK